MNDKMKKLVILAILFFISISCASAVEMSSDEMTIADESTVIIKDNEIIQEIRRNANIIFQNAEEIDKITQNILDKIHNQKLYSITR